MIRIRLEGIISACTRRHPLKSAAKIVQIEKITKENHIFLGFSEMQPIFRLKKDGGLIQNRMP
jgi:hypothetical protein